MTIRAITAAMVAALAAACVSVPAAHATETIAFQANTGHLWYWSSDSRDGYQHGTGHDLHLGMMKASAQASLTMGAASLISTSRFRRIRAISGNTLPPPVPVAIFSSG